MVFSRWTKQNKVRDKDYNTVSNYYHHIGVEAAKTLGHQRDNFILECKLVQKIGFYSFLTKCGDSVTTEYAPSPEYYNCFAISTKKGGHRQHGCQRAEAGFAH